jgi:hypothetical protein
LSKHLASGGIQQRDHLNAREEDWSEKSEHGLRLRSADAEVMKGRWARESMYRQLCNPRIVVQLWSQLPALGLAKGAHLFAHNRPEAQGVVLGTCRTEHHTITEPLLLPSRQPFGVPTHICLDSCRCAAVIGSSSRVMIVPTRDNQSASLDVYQTRNGLVMRLELGLLHRAHQRSACWRQGSLGRFQRVLNIEDIHHAPVVGSDQNLTAFTSCQSADPSLPSPQRCQHLLT